MKPTTLSRRNFLKFSTLLSSGLIVSCSSPGMQPLSKRSELSQELLDVSAWLHISPEGIVTYQVPSSEMGQGALTGLTMIVAEELDADWNNIRTEFAPLNSKFSNPMWFSQNTGGSGSVMGFWEPMRELGATARYLLVLAAASTMGTDASEFTTSEGRVIHQAGRSFSYGELVEVAAQLEAPKNIPLKQPEAFKLIGKPIPRLDIPDKTVGKAEYGIDVNIPDLKVATLLLSPTVGGDVVSYDISEAKKIQGFHSVVQIPKDVAAEQQPAGLAIIADNYHSALKASRAVKVTWDEGPNSQLSTELIRQDLRGLLDEVKRPDLSDRTLKFEAEYEVPYLSQSPLEPMNATARVTDAACEVWAPCQNQTIAGKFASKISGLDVEQITLHTTYLGGGFGRRLEADYVAFAVYVARESGLPVKVLWSREEDTKHGYYRPASIARFQVALDDEGYPDIWKSQLAVPTFLGRFLGQLMPATKILPVDSMTKSAQAMGMSQGFMAGDSFQYAMNKIDVDVKISKVPVPTGNHRAVAHSYTGFFAESAIDEAAHTAGEDPYQYRRKLLLKAEQDGADVKRLVHVLDIATKRANWGEAKNNRAQGVAIAHGNGSYVAHVVDLSVDANKHVTFHKIHSVIDCGIAVNPDLVITQVEGGVFWSLAAVFKEEITIDKGQVVQNNFYDYQTLHTKDMPEIDVHIIPSGEPPTGAGEPPIPPLPPAVTNAIFAATGERLRRLPISHAGYTI